MPTKEEIEAQLKASLAKTAELEEKLSKISTKPAVYIKGHKTPTFNGEQDVAQWVEDVQEHIEASYVKESEKVSYIKQHLQGSAKLEIKFRDPGGAATSKEVLQMLKDAFSPQETISTVLHKLYSRKQEKHETIEHFCISLMEIMCNLRRLGWKTGEQDHILKERLAEGARDPNLRRELHRLNSERSSLKFHELRLRAVKWLAEEHKLESSSHEQETKVTIQDGAHSDMTRIIEEQNKALAEMRTALSELQSSDSHYQKSRFNHQDSRSNLHTRQETHQQHTTSNKFCKYCRRTNHFIEDCWVLKKKKEKELAASKPQPTPTNHQHTDQGHLNFNPSKPGAADWRK